MIKVNVLEAKNRLSELLRAVAAGEEVVIANRGQPVARLVAAAPAEPLIGLQRPCLNGWTKIRFRKARAGRAEEIDADIAAEREAWD